MRRGSGFLCLLTSVLWYVSLVVASTSAYGQGAGELPTADQLNELLAPVALYPDQLVAQICAASTDPQQILDVNTWVKQNANLSPQALTDAAQSQGFDPAFIALVSFPQVLDTMAQNIDDYATIGRAFTANQATVMDAIQRLRQQAYAAGNLESNDYQKVDVQTQGSVQAVTIVPANPQIVYVPVYNPQVVYVQPDPGAVVAASVITFGVGIALGAWIAGSSHPWGWGGWGWNWGHSTVIVHNNYWVVHNRYHPPRPYYHYRPPMYNRPVYVRPPNNWHDRPYRPPGGRPPGGGPPGGRPPPGGGPGGKPPGIYPPPGNGKPPGGGGPGGGGPGSGKPPGGGNPGSGSPGGGKPPGGGGPGTNPPGNGRPPGGGNPGGPGSKPPGTGAPGTPNTRPAPGVTPQPRPSTRPATPAPAQTRPSGSFSGYPGKAPAASNSGARPSAFGGSHNASADRAATNRGRASSQQHQQRSGGQRR